MYFHSAFTDSLFTLTQDLPDRIPGCSDLNVRNEEVFQVLSSLDPSKALGKDDIGPKVIKYCAVAVYEPHQPLIYNQYSSAKIPAEWKTHCVPPIHKTEDRAEIIDQSPFLQLQRYWNALFYNKYCDFFDHLLSPS